MRNAVQNALNASKVEVVPPATKTNPTIPASTPLFTSNNADIDLDGVDAPDKWPNQRMTSFNYADGTSLSAYKNPYIVVPGSSEFTKYVGCVALVWDSSSSQGFYAVVGDVRPSSKMGEVSIYLAQQFKPGDPFVNSKGVEYALTGSFTYYIIPGSDIRGTATPQTINGMINSKGREYFGY